MSAIIQADYEQLQQLAQRFQRRAESIQQVQRQIESRMVRLALSWDGAGAAAFQREMRAAVLPALTRLRAALGEATRITSRISTTVLQAEQEAARLFSGEAAAGIPVSNASAGGGATTIPLVYRGDSVTTFVQDSGSPEPTTEGQEYLDAASQVDSVFPDVVPVLVGMIVRNEWNNRAYEHTFLFLATQTLDPDFSYGAGQIQGDTAMGMIEKYPELFTDYPQIYIDGTLTKGRVEWELFVNKTFNLRVAALLIGEYGAQIESGLEAAGITITDTPQSGELSITPLQRDQLTAIMYNEGPGNVYAAIANSSPAEIIEYINNKIAANETHVSNVWSNQEHVETQVDSPLSSTVPLPTATPTLRA